MPSRRALLAGLAASAVAPAWAATGATHLAAARMSSGSYALIGLTSVADIAFRIPLPARGHAAAAHPFRPQAVAFARRPGTFGMVIDCGTGAVIARLAAPAGRHFYGHGAYTADGAHLLTTENAFATGEGRIGIWDSVDWRRVDEVPSGGIGPHEILRLASGRFAIANGGIRTHPDRGREKLNLDTMRPNLAYLRDGTVADIVELPALRQASIRHLAAAGDRVAMALQWEGPESRVTPLLALHGPGAAAELLDAGPEQAALRGYAGSVAFSGDGRHVAITAPRGGLAHIYHAAEGALHETVRRAEICGVAPDADGLMFTDGLGGVLRAAGATRHPVAWDNHLVAL
ncbi:MAG: DUF1513 domain-containing protein [Pseudomonadota bacterium]